MPGFNSKPKIIPPIDLRDHRSVWGGEDNPISEEEPLPEEKPISDDRTKLINIANKSSMSNNIPSNSPTSIEQRMNSQRSSNSTDKLQSITNTGKEYLKKFKNFLTDDSETQQFEEKYKDLVNPDIMDKFRDIRHREFWGLDDTAKSEKKELYDLMNQMKGK